MTSQDGICKSFEMMIEPGDAIVVEEFIFAGILVQIFLKTFFFVNGAFSQYSLMRWVC